MDSSPGRLHLTVTNEAQVVDLLLHTDRVIVGRDKFFNVENFRTGLKAPLGSFHFSKLMDETNVRANFLIQASQIFHRII